ncbi:MAG: hypothetical protein WCS94_23455 [Verrucomicrobiota bacterium]
MNFCNDTAASDQPKICHDLGTFEGFNFRTQSPIQKNLTADELVNWDHDRQGEAEFWPAGDNAGVSLLFSKKSAVTGGELLALDSLLADLGDDSTANFLRIYYAVSSLGEELSRLTASKVEDCSLQIFEGTSFLDLRKEAAFELFELYYPEEYRVWEKSLCDGLIFDHDRFLDSPCWSVDEVTLNGAKALIVAAQ